MTEAERTHAVYMLRHYHESYEKLANIARRLNEIDGELYNIKALRTDREAVQGGASGAEARLDKLIDDKTKLQQNQRRITDDLTATERALQTMRTFDAEVLTRYYCFGLSYEVIATQYNYSVRSIRRIKHRALSTFSDIVHGNP